MRIYLIRHGQTDWNKEDVAIGQTDVPLSELGFKQVAALSRRFEGVTLSRIISSDLIRCQFTARAISSATGTPIEYDPRLRERSFGDWEGEDYSSVTTRLYALSVEQGIPFSRVNPPNGESHEHVWTRVEPVIKPLFDADRDIAIVSHGGTSRVLLSILIRATHATTFCFKFDNASVTHLDRRPDGAFLLGTYNSTSHLESIS